MYNKNFHKMSHLEKKEKIKKTLTCKVPQITKEQIEHVIKHIDFNSQYHIKAVSNSTKFLNLIEEEETISSEGVFKKCSFYIYGAYEKGFFFRFLDSVYQNKGKFYSDVPAAALCIYIYYHPNTVNYTFRKTLVFYSA